MPNSLYLIYGSEYLYLFACIVDQDWIDGRLPWLDIVLVRLDGVGLKRVSWEVRYVDKPQWRAVISVSLGFE